MDVRSIGHLSPELFLEIFDHCLTATESGAEPHLGVNLSHVSKSWRRLALDHSPLWTKISSKRPMAPSVVRMVLQYIERSKKKPLDIQLCLYSEFDKQEPGDVTLVMEALVAQIARWRIIRIVVPSSWHDLFPEPFLQFRQLISMSAVPLLEGASFNPPFNVNDKEDSIFKMCEAVNFTTQIFQGGAPSLRFLRKTGCGFPLFLPPLQSITNLQIIQTEFMHSILVWDELHQILSLPNLETLLLAGYDIGHAVDFPDDHPPIHMPCLRNFYYDSIPPFFENLINVMDPCCIERLVLRGFEGSLVDDPPELFQSLSTLDLLECVFDLAFTIFFMKMAPNLRTLNFTESSYRDRADDSESEEDPHEIIYRPGNWRSELGIAHYDDGGGGRNISQGHRYLFIDMLYSADRGNFHPWRSLSTLRYAPFPKYPTGNAMSRFLSHRKQRGAPPISLLQVPDWWFHEKWEQFQPELHRIRQDVELLNQWDGHQNWEYGPAPPESELAIEDVRFHSRDSG